MPGDLWSINYPHMYSTVNAKSLFGFRSNWFNSADVGSSMQGGISDIVSTYKGSKASLDFKLNKDTSFNTLIYGESSLLDGNLSNSALLNWYDQLNSLITVMYFSQYKQARVLNN